jgi:hypothetical protein
VALGKEMEKFNTLMALLMKVNGILVKLMAKEF